MYIYARREGEGGGEVSPLLLPWLLITTPATSVGFSSPVHLRNYRTAPGRWWLTGCSGIYRAVRGRVCVNPESRFRMCASGGCSSPCVLSTAGARLSAPKCGGPAAGGSGQLLISSQGDGVVRRGRRRSVGTPARRPSRPPTCPRMQQLAVRLRPLL